MMAVHCLTNTSWPVLFSTKRVYQKTLLQLFRNLWRPSTPNKITSNYKVVLPANVTEQVSPDKFSHRIALPPYALTGIPTPLNDEVNVFGFQFCQLPLTP